MRNIANGCSENFTLRNTEISLMHITSFRKTVDYRGEVTFSCQKHIYIDNGLGRRIGDSRTPTCSIATAALPSAPAICLRMS